MNKARDVFVIGQLVQVLVHNSTYGCIGKVVAFNDHNAYNVKVSFDGGLEQGYMVNELRPIPKLGHKLTFVGKIKRAYYRWRNSDPVHRCPVYKNDGCCHVDGPLCDFPKCSMYHEYMGHRWVSCAECEYAGDCCSVKFGLGCYDGKPAKS